MSVTVHGQISSSYAKGLEKDYAQVKKRLWGPAVPFQDNVSHPTSPVRPPPPKTLAIDPFESPQFIKALAIVMYHRKYGRHGPRRIIRLADILRIGCGYFDITKEDVIGKDKNRLLSRQRQVLMYLMRSMTHKSLPEVCHFLERDHTTILHGYRATESRMEKSTQVRNQIELLREMIILQNEDNEIYLPPGRGYVRD